VLLISREGRFFD